MFLGTSLGDAQEIAPIFKEQHRSSTNWGEINLKTFMSLQDWKNQSDERDEVPGWETIVRERNNREIVGRFFQCVGNCRIDRGQTFFKPNFSTAIYEGDEIQTLGESFAWVFLFDGTMVRLSPESSIHFNEFNVGIKENFLSARVNAGNILWLSRNESLLEEVESVRETDVLFNPLSLYEAQAIPDRKKYNENNLLDLVSENKTVLNQYKHLNELILKNNKLTNGKPTYSFIVMPNVTLMGYKPSLEIVSLLGGKTFFKKRSNGFLGLKEVGSEQEVSAQLRGFENNELATVESDKWFMIDEKGRFLTQALDNLYWLTMGEFITKRIPSLLVAREVLLTQYSEFAFRDKYDPMTLAQDNGYRLWGALKSEGNSKKTDLELQLDFLKEYFRRIETTNLLVSSHFRERLTERGENLKSMEYGNYFFSKALDKYYSYDEINFEKETGEILNSTTKNLWKRLHGIKD